MRSITSFIGIASVAVFAACSSPPKQDTPTGGANDSISAAIDTKLVKEGYRAVKRKNQLLYCRSEMVTGTRLSSKVCLTEEQIRGRQQKTEEAVDLMNKMRATAACAGQPGCGG
jgi:hypothetical protein